MIHALPGAGADHRMFPPPWTTLPEFRAHDWPASSRIFTIPALAEAMVERAGIREGDVVIGTSLGGMVACEVSRLRRLRAVVLVGSATGAADVSFWLRNLEPLLPLVPMEFIRRSAESVPGEVAAMFGASDPLFVRNLCAAIAEWKGAAEWPAPIIRIHGRYDRVIPPPAKADLLLEAGHLVSMTHAAECTALVARRLATLA